MLKREKLIRPFGSKKRLFALLGIFLTSRALDIGSTYLVIGSPNIIEGNPIVRFLINSFGFWEAALIHTTFMVAFILIFSYIAFYWIYRDYGVRVDSARLGTMIFILMMSLVGCIYATHNLFFVTDPSFIIIALASWLSLTLLLMMIPFAMRSVDFES